MYSLSDQQTAEAAFMVRKGDFMLRYIMEEDTYYLHNLKEDRKEGENLIAQYPELTQEMKTIFKDWFPTDDTSYRLASTVMAKCTVLDSFIAQTLAGEA